MRFCRAREETVGLMEIDKEATMADTKQLGDEDLVILNVHRTGSAYSARTSIGRASCVHY